MEHRNDGAVRLLDAVFGENGLRVDAGAGDHFVTVQQVIGAQAFSEGITNENSVIKPLFSNRSGVFRKRFSPSGGVFRLRGLRLTAGRVGRNNGGLKRDGLGSGAIAIDGGKEGAEADDDEHD